MFLGVPKSLVVRLGWTTLSYGCGQVLRLLNNVILARLLAPPIFGLMARVNAIRTGVELPMDVLRGLAGLRTVGQVVDYLEAQIAASPPPDRL